MKKLLIASAVFFISLAAQAQAVSRIQLTETIPGICNSENVYRITKGKNQKLAEPLMAKGEILAKMKEEVRFLITDPKFQGFLVIYCFVNCKGELVKCEVDKSSGSTDLDRQVTEIFKSVTAWKPATLNKENVDSARGYNVEVKNGNINFK